MATLGTTVGTITTQNLVPTGDATPGSAVEVDVVRSKTLGIQVTGTYTGTLTLQVMVNSTSWITVGGTPFLNKNTGAYLATITSALQSVFLVDVTGMSKIRVTGLAAMTGTATVEILASDDASFASFASALPAGTASIGTVVLGSPATATTTSGFKTEDAVAATGDVGVMALGVRRDAAVASTSATGDYSELRVDQFGQQAMVPGVSGTNTITRVTSSATTVSLLAANTSRKGAIFYNESTAILYLKFGATASVTSYTVQIPANGTYELKAPITQAAIDGIWAAANGAVMITEQI